MHVSPTASRVIGLGYRAWQAGLSSRAVLWPHCQAPRLSMAPASHVLGRWPCSCRWLKGRAVSSLGRPTRLTPCIQLSKENWCKDEPMQRVELETSSLAILLATLLLGCYWHPIAHFFPCDLEDPYCSVFPLPFSLRFKGIGKSST